MTGEHKIVGGAREFELEGNGAAPYEHISPFVSTLRAVAFYQGPPLKLKERVKVIEYSAYEAAIRERDLAIAHDRQAYPTASAYEQVCKVLESEREKLTKAVALIDSIKNNIGFGGRENMIAAMDKIVKFQTEIHKSKPESNSEGE